MPRTIPLGAAILAMLAAGSALAKDGASQDEVLAPVDQRFSQEDIQETPDFQRHVVPLFGRLGCNGRACHGSFQGQGGFRLSLFGYDFKAGRVDWSVVLNLKNLTVEEYYPANQARGLPRRAVVSVTAKF